MVWCLCNLTADAAPPRSGQGHGISCCESEKAAAFGLLGTGSGAQETEAGCGVRVAVVKWSGVQCRGPAC